MVLVQAIKYPFEFKGFAATGFNVKFKNNNVFKICKKPEAFCIIGGC